MGCCSSRETRPAEGPHPSSPSTSTPTSTAAPLDGEGRLNQPLRTPSAVKHSPPQLALSPWTPSELHRQREAFFETRVSGHAHVWVALKRVCEHLRSGNMKEAQGVFDASGLTCPSGKVAVERRRGGQKKGGVYDDKGSLYEIPGWIVSDPLDLVPEVEGKEIDEEDDDDNSALEEKIGDMVNVTARLSDRGTDVVVEVGTNQKVGVLVKKVQEKLGGEQKVKLAYMGKILDEHKTLAANNWKEGHVLNGLVFG